MDFPDTSPLITPFPSQTSEDDFEASADLSMEIHQRSGPISKTERRLPPPTEKTAHIPPDKYRYLWDLFNLADEDGSGEVRKAPSFSPSISF